VRTLMIILIFLGGLLGLFMTACGGFFTIASLDTGGSSGSYIQGVWALALPCALLGIGILLLCRRAWRKLQLPPAPHAGDIPPDQRVM
jgi:hypothetical protein